MEQMNASTWQEAATIAKSNPDIVQGTWPSPGQHLQMRVDKTPFTDIKVRTALQMAVDLPTIAKTHYGGLVPGVGCGLIYPGFTGYTLPFDQWDANLQKEFTYNVAGAKQLLTDAGYPNGFKTDIVAAATGEDIELLQIVKSEFMDIGVDMTINMFADLPAKQAYMQAMKHDQMAYANSVGVAQAPNMAITRIMPGAQGNGTANDDAKYVDLIKQAQSAKTEADAKKLCTEVDIYGLQQHWCVNITPTVSPIFWQPWVKENSGEMIIGGLARFYYTRWWIDSSLKK